MLNSTGARRCEYIIELKKIANDVQCRSRKLGVCNCGYENNFKSGAYRCGKW